MPASQQMALGITYGPATYKIGYLVVGGGASGGNVYGGSSVCGGGGGAGGFREDAAYSMLIGDQ